MASKKKLLQAAAGSAGGAALDVDEVFSTFLYDGTGTGSNLTVTNNIDLSTEGGLVWVKNRDATAAHALFDTVRGQNILESQSAGAQDAFSAYGGSASASYNTNGFGINGTGASNLNQSGVDYVSWTFRKAPKFFDVVTWTGNGVNGRTISHNLGSTPGMILVKSTSGSDGWITYHRGMDASSPEDYAMFLNLTNARATETYWNNTAPTSTGFTVSNNVKLNGGSGQTYVAYLFAHNNNDGEFGPDSDQDIIKCGSYTGTGAAGNSINLGFEPQWLLVKSATRSGQSWELVDTMRGFTYGLPVSGTTDERLRPNDTAAGESSFNVLEPTPTGFETGSAVTDEINESGQTYIYMAIRRGPLAVPDDATKVFEPVAYTGNGTTSRQVGSISRADLVIVTDRNNDSDATSYGNGVFDRLRGGELLRTNGNNAKSGGWSPGYFNLDQSGGWRTGDQSGGINYYNKSSSAYISWTWKRAPGYFDVVAYKGTSPASGDTKSHNLGVVPEMIWVKNRDGVSGGARPWIVYHKDTGNTGYLKLNETSALITSDPESKFGNGTVGVSPTASSFTVAGDYEVNYSTDTYIAYLFATVAGVSKVGSFSHTNGSTTNVDCGFSSGARFVLIKRTDASDNWYVWDTERGIVAGTEGRLSLNLTDAEYTLADDIDPLSSGFTIASGVNTGSYIFYAIA